MNKNINDIKNPKVRLALWQVTNQDTANLDYVDLQNAFNELLNACIKADKYDEKQTGETIGVAVKKAYNQPKPYKVVFQNIDNDNYYYYIVTAENVTKAQEKFKNEFPNTRIVTIL